MKYIRKIKNIITWLPVLWEDENFDYAFLLRVIEFKCDKIADHIQKHHLITDADKVAEELRQVRQLIFAYEHVFDNDKPTKRKDWARLALKAEQAAWNAIWDHIKTHGRGWWD